MLIEIPFAFFLFSALQAIRISLIEAVERKRNMAIKKLSFLLGCFKTTITFAVANQNR
jgi:hypothetical protein